jgi:hypothetical protein
VSTDILRRNSLDTPEDADIVIGYLFMVSNNAAAPDARLFAHVTHNVLS